MQKEIVLIIDARRELSMKYKRVIEQNCMIPTIISQDEEEALKVIQEVEPDLIILSDSVATNANNLCVRIRQETKTSRPVVIALSKSSYVEDKLALLNSGADDFLSEPVDQSEFCARIFAHLRRHHEEASNPVTVLPLANTTYKVLRRSLKLEKDWALMLVDIDYFDSYAEMYGDLASNKMLQAFSAILKSATDSKDFLGQIDHNVFAIITSSIKSSKIASFLKYTFDAISVKFYTEEDQKRGYLILHGDEKAGIRIPLVSTSIGIVSNKYKPYKDHYEVMFAVKEMHKKAKHQPGSSCITDCLQLCGDVSKDLGGKLNKILVIEKDAALAYLLTATLDMQGYQTEATSNYDEVIAKIYEFKPDLVVLDTGAGEPDSALEICNEIKDNASFSRIKVIVSTIVHDKEKILDAGADLYLPKPYELMSLFSWINKLLNYM